MSKPARPAPATIGEVAAAYLAYRSDLKRSSIRAEAQTVRYQIAPRFGTTAPSQVRRPDVREWETAMRRQGVSQRSVTKAVQLLRRLLAFAADDDQGWIAASPLADYRPARPLAPAGRGFQEVLRGPELLEVIDAAASLRDRTLLRAAIELLLRKGEVVGLTWGDIDLEQRRVNVSHNVWSYSNGTGRRQHQRQIVKGSQAATLPISRGLVYDLETYRDSLGEQPLDAAYVWPGRGDPSEPMSESTPNAALRRALRGANEARAARGIPALPHISFHGLRHSGVTQLLQSEVPLPRVSLYARHKDQRITASLYSHVVASGLEMIADHWERAASNDAEERSS